MGIVVALNGICFKIYSFNLKNLDLILSTQGNTHTGVQN